MAKWFYAMPGRRLMDERLAPDFLQQMTRRYGVATLVQIAAVPVVIAVSRIGVAIALLCVAFFLLPPPKFSSRGNLLACRISASTTALESLLATFTRITNRL
jgi:hypothetical protein